MGDPFSEASTSRSAMLDLGTVAIDGSTVSASGVTVTNFDDFSESAGALQIDC